MRSSFSLFGASIVSPSLNNDLHFFQQRFRVYFQRAIYMTVAKLTKNLSFQVRCSLKV